MAVHRILRVLDGVRSSEWRLVTGLLCGATLIVGCTGSEPLFTRIDDETNAPDGAAGAGAHGGRRGTGGSTPGSGGSAGANAVGGAGETGELGEVGEIGGAGDAGGPAETAGTAGTGGATGAAGAGPESSGGATAATGGTGLGGEGGIGGAGGVGRGGLPAGTGGSAVVAPASGGATASGGRTGGGGGGGGGVAGTKGGGGMGGASPPRPCTGLCANPGQVPIKTLQSLGTGATCHEVVGTTVTGLVCGNFEAPRTFSVNAAPFDCVTGGLFTLPRPRNGGFCMQASAGGPAFAYFNTF